MAEEKTNHDEIIRSKQALKAQEFAKPWLIRAYAPEDCESLVALWQQCGLTRAWNNPYLDIERKRANRPEWLRIAEVQRSAQRWELIGSIMIGYEGPKLSLLVRCDNEAVRAFYQRLGYGVDQAIAMGKRLIPDD
jgi:hypothetical protein